MGPGTRFSVARLLADLPGERLGALEAVWGVETPGAAGRIAGLYRRMTDPNGRAGLLSRFPEATGMAFAGLARARRPLTTRELGRALPFSDEAIERSLVDLEVVGLVWRTGLSGRDQRSDERQWFVPLEMCDRPAATRPRPADNGTAGEGRAIPPPPAPRLLAAPPAAVHPSASLAMAISRLLGQANQSTTSTLDRPASLLTYAEHCAIALGVVQRRRARLAEGPRADAWRQSAPAEQARALARLWLVDDGSGHEAPAWVRRRAWEVVRQLNQAAWYDLSSVAASMAWRATATGAGAADRAIDRRGADSRQLLSRRQVDGAIEVLGWIGVLVIGADGRGRPIAIQLGEHGRLALE